METRAGCDTTRHRTRQDTTGDGDRWAGWLAGWLLLSGWADWTEWMGWMGWERRGDGSRTGTSSKTKTSAETGRTRRVGPGSCRVAGLELGEAGKGRESRSSRSGPALQMHDASWKALAYWPGGWSGTSPLTFPRPVALLADSHSLPITWCLMIMPWSPFLMYCTQFHPVCLYCTHPPMLIHKYRTLVLMPCRALAMPRSAVPCPAADRLGW